VRAPAAGCLCAAFLATAAGASSTTITQSSIGGARLGLKATTYRHLFGTSGLKLQVNRPGGGPTGWTKLVFNRPAVAAYFRPGHIRSEVITTWERRYKTDEGIGPCSLLDDVKLAYGDRLKPSMFNTQHGHVYAWVLGKNLIFAVGWRNYVQAVGVYNGSDPRVDKPGRSLSWAGSITLSERTCNRS
jgi:hypothetical protein